MGRWRVGLGVVSIVVLAACTGSDSSGSSTTTGPARAGRASLSIRPVVALLPPSPPGPADIEAQPGTEILEARGGAAGVRYAVGPVAMTGTAVRSARALDIPGQGWVVELSLNRRGKQQLNELAGQLYAKPPPGNAVAIAVDGVVESAPAFMAKSFSGDVQISSLVSEARAKALAASLAP